MIFPEKLYKIIVVVFILYGCKPKTTPLFTTVDSRSSGIDFANSVQETDELNIVEYLYAYNGGGVAIGDVNNDGLSDIYFTANQLPNKLYINKGNFVFEDITDSAGVAAFSGPQSWTNGVSLVDINADGFLDIYISVIGKYKHLHGRNQLFINNKDLTFTEAAVKYNLDIVGFSQQAFFFDYDLDGDLDMYQLNHAVHKPEVYVKNESRTKRDSLTGDRLFRNENNKFVDISVEAGIYGGAAGYGLAAGISDLDKNGYPDIYISNDFHENDFLYLNNGDGTFMESGAKAIGHTSRFSMGNDISDINNDGLFDIISLDMKPYDEEIHKNSMGEAPHDVYDFRLGYGYHYQYSRNMLQLNRGKINGESILFSEIGQQAGIEATDWSWSPSVADFDNDGWKDLFITNGIMHRPNNLDYINFAYNEHAKQLTDLELTNKMPDGAVANFAYKNDGALGFKEVSKEWGINQEGYSMGAAYGDLDNDGDLDLVINNLNSEATVLRNNSNTLHQGKFLKIKLNGPEKNRFGLGAKVILETNNTSQTQEVFPTRGWLSSVDPMLHFGLADVDNVQSVQIIWPGGKSQRLEDVQSNTTVEFNWKQAVSHEENTDAMGQTIFNKKIVPSIDFSHQENAYNDFKYERLIPHKLSSIGPKMAVGDVNGDGLDDFYIGGAKNQSGRLYHGTPDGGFKFKNTTLGVFWHDRAHEDTDAVFFDADNDQDLDLYVVSGGGEHGSTLLLEDRLYINNGLGDYKRSGKVKTSTSNGATVVADDFDKDGHIDLFVGSRSVIGSYGLSPKSDILWNQGNLQFDMHGTSNTSLDLGMVTDAVFLKDSNELAIVGEWMPITLLSFDGRSCKTKTIQNTSGWWNSIHVDDMDGDGDLDLLAGNYGTNFTEKPSVEKPLGLYVKDFDGNASTDPIMTHWRHNKEWIFVGLDELKTQMVSARKQFNTYQEYADKTFKESFNRSELKDAVYKTAETLESLYIEKTVSSTYKINALPAESQWSSIHGFATTDFDGDGIKDIVTTGNFYESQPSIGRADASYGNFLKGDGKGGFVSVGPNTSGWIIKGEGRDIKVLKGKNRDLPMVLVSRNNDSLLVFEFK